MKKTQKPKKLKIERLTLVHLDVVRGGLRLCTAYTNSDVKSECASNCIDCK